MKRQRLPDSFLGWGWPPDWTGGEPARETNRVGIPAGRVTLNGALVLPPKTEAIVLFVHASDHRPRPADGSMVAKQLNHAGFGTLLLDLLTPKESAFDAHTGYGRFDIELLTRRVIKVTHWLQRQTRTQSLSLGYLAMDTAASAALIAAAQLKPAIRGIVCRSGRPHFAGEVLSRVDAPTLFIVTENEEGTVAVNRAAFDRLACTKELTVLAAAGQDLTGIQDLERFTTLAAAWFTRHLKPPTAP